MDQTISKFQEVIHQVPSHSFHPEPGLWKGLAMKSFHLDPYFSPGNLYLAFRINTDWLLSHSTSGFGLRGKPKSILVWNQGRFPLEGFPEALACLQAGYRPIIKSSPANILLFKTFFEDSELGFSELGIKTTRQEIDGMIGGSFLNSERSTLARYFGNVWLSPEKEPGRPIAQEFGDGKNFQDLSHFLFAYFGKHPLNCLRLHFETLPDPASFLEACGEYKELQSHFAFSNLIAFQRLTLGVQMVPFHDLGIALLYSADQQKTYPFPCFSVTGHGKDNGQPAATGPENHSFEILMKEYLEDQFTHALNFVENL